jgi:putative endonuclease
MSGGFFVIMDFFIYILQSVSTDKYYVGFSENPHKRLFEHNNPIYSKFTSKYIPWELKVFFFASNDRGEAMKIERYIKNMKSKKYTENLISNVTEQVRISQLFKS